MKQRIICILLAVMILLSSVDITVFAQTEGGSVAEYNTVEEELPTISVLEDKEKEEETDSVDEAKKAGNVEILLNEEENVKQLESKEEEEIESEIIQEDKETDDIINDINVVKQEETTDENSFLMQSNLENDDLIKVGDYIVLGKYNGQPIIWRCVDIDENGPLMFSDRILCLKPFDAAGYNSSSSHARGNYSYHKRSNRGSSYWADSNIRDWLNSTAQAGEVIFSDGLPPENSAVYGGYDDYADESGFLSEDNFSSEEISVMKTVTQKFILNKVDVGLADGGTNGHQEGLSINNFLLNYDTAYYKNTTDKVFLINLAQLKKIYDNFGTDYLKGYITAEGAEKSERNVQKGGQRSYWLRDSMWNDFVCTHARAVGMVTEGRELDFYWGYDDKGVGVRPAFYLDTEISQFEEGNGRRDNPYKIIKKENMDVVPGDFDESSDKAIIAEVTKYTSDELYAQWNAIINSSFDNEEKFRRLNELSHNNGITDVREGIQYFSEVSSHRRDYLYLTTNENYCAFNWWYWLNTTTKGKVARGLLYADGLIFNFELSSYLDWSTYANEKYPGVEKCKVMLKDFMEIDNKETLASEVASNSKKISKNIKNAIKLNNIVADAEMEEIMNGVINAKTNIQLEKYQQQFADWLIKQARIQQIIEEGGEVKLYLGVESISKAMGFASPIIDVTSATTEDIVGIMNLENEIKKYEEYEGFLSAIYSDTDVSKEMRIAAYQLNDEIQNGYIKKVRSILTHFLKFEFEIGKIYMDKGLLKTYLESHGLETGGLDLLGEAMGTISLATVISNIVIDTGDFVKQAAYTMSYAELATLYSFKVQEDKAEFRRNPNAENAWKFYEDYNLLWRLRYKGEEQYLEMNSVKAFIFGKINSLGYAYKESVVKDILEILQQCKFELADNIIVPKSVQYVKKSVIECPVDVYVYTMEGELIAELKDGIISDIFNEYGRFSVVYESYSGEYGKVICQTSDIDLDIQIVPVNSGLVDYKFAENNTSDILSFDKVSVKKGDIIKIVGQQYKVINGDGTSDELRTLDVLSEEYVKPESILVGDSSIELLVGKEKTLEIAVLPYNTTNKNVNWYSENEEVAKIKNGVITAQSIGETVIWLSTCDNINVEKSIAVKVVASKEEVKEEDSLNTILDKEEEGIKPFYNISEMADFIQMRDSQNVSKDQEAIIEKGLINHNEQQVANNIDTEDKSVEEYSESTSLSQTEVLNEEKQNQKDFVFLIIAISVVPVAIFYFVYKRKYKRKK